MSTRAAIGRVAGDTFEGRYQHSDGYPTWLGKHFAQRAREADDLRAFLAYVVDEHRAGWSYFGQQPGEDRCYCHPESWAPGRESEPNRGEPITDCDLFIEWAYAINADTRAMGAWVAVPDSSRDQQQIGHGGRPYTEPGYRGQLIAIVPIDDEATDWAAIERKGGDAHESARLSEAGKVGAR